MRASQREGDSDEAKPARVPVELFGMLPDGRAPLYRRVGEQIRRMIDCGVVATGAQLPTEEELARHFGVSSITVRSALKELQDGGRIERRQGRGTFVRQSEARHAEWGLGSVEDLVMTGRMTKVEVLRCAAAPAPAWVRELLGEPPTEGFLHLRITRNLHGRPLMMTDAYYPESVSARMRRPDLAQLFARSPLLIEVVERLTGDRVTDMRQSMTAGLVSKHIAVTIGVKPGSPVLVVTRINRTHDGRLLQVARSHYRTDGVAYSIHLKRG